MKIKFDSLNRYEVPLFHLCNPGCTYQDGLLTRSVGILSNTSDEELILNFNAKSELNLRVYKVRYEDEEEDRFFQSLYRMIANRREIFVDGIGFFVISDVKEEYSDYQDYKDITAYSCEQEIEDKKIPYIQDGTYPLLDTGDTEGLLSMLVKRLPYWQIGTVDVNTASLYRTFEDVATDRNVLAFMMEDMQDAYECIFVFDPINRLINVYDQNNYVMQTDIHFTKNDLIESSSIEEDSSSLYTALSVTGNDDTTIAEVNPLGTSVIYNFGYYLDWMSSGLSSKVKSWQNLVDSSYDNYYDLSVQYAQYATQAATAKLEVERLSTVLDMYQKCRENIVAESGTSQVASYNSIISANGGTTIPLNQTDINQLKSTIDGYIRTTKTMLDAAQSEYDSANTHAEEVRGQQDTIRQSVDITTYFSQAEYEELSSYIVEGDYKDDYVVITDSMDQTERLEQISEVYKRAKTTIDKAAYPTQKYTVDVENFLFQSKFQHFSDRLETGCLVNVELEEDDVAELFLTTITVNWDDHELALTFGNRFNRFDPKALFENALGNIQKSANSIEYLKALVSPIANGELNNMQNAIANSRNLAKNEALASTNNVIVIDDTGYTGRKLLIDGESFDPRQIKIVNNQIVFTKDGWETASTAIGEIIIRNADGTTTTAYGVNAEMLIGDLILGNQLQIGYTSSSGATQDITSGILESVSTEYYLSESASTLSGGSWSSAFPSAQPDGTFLWVRDVYTYADGSSTTSEPVCAEGVPGADGQPGENALALYISSSNGNIFKNGDIQTVLSARVYSGSTDVTDDYDSNAFIWTRVSSDTSGDAAWNQNHYGGTKQITITSSDVHVRATFFCDLIDTTTRMSLL